MKNTCTALKHFINKRKYGRLLNNSLISYHIIPIRQGGKAEKAATKVAACQGLLLLPEGLAVGTLIHSGIHFMGAHQDPIQRAIICAAAVMCALLHSALNGLVCLFVHFWLPPFFEFGFGIPAKVAADPWKSYTFFFFVAFSAKKC
jgi:hypothetical protein